MYLYFIYIFVYLYIIYYINYIILYLVIIYHIYVYRVIHKSVKRFKNSQQINYSTDHGRSYADRDRNSPSFFFYTDVQFVHLW